MSTAVDEAEERSYICCVVSVGYDGHSALRDVARENHRGWCASAVGPYAGQARADRTLHTDDDGESDPQALLARLEEIWSTAEFVYVVFDQRDATARALALSILEGAHAPNRLTVAVLLGTTHAAHAEPAALFCNAVFRLRDRPAGDSLSPSDALRGVLSAFEACALPISLGSLGAWLLGSRDNRVVTTRASDKPLDIAVSRLFANSSADTPCLLHLVCGEDALTFSAARETLEAVQAHDPDLSALIADEVARDELLVTAVIPVLHRPRGTAARRLWTIAADRAAERLPTGVYAPIYERRLRHELQTFWVARDENAETLLWLAEQVERLNTRGFAVGPALRNAGGSLAAYLLGLSVFDPVEWELPFDEFVNGRDAVVLEALVSPRTLAERAVPELEVRADGSTQRVAFIADPRLEDIGRLPPWTRVLDATRATLDRDAARAAPRAIGLESDVALVPGIAALTECSGGRLLYDHQIATTISQLMMVSYPEADRVRRLLAEGGASADEAIARIVRVRTRGDAGAAAIEPIVERLRRRALTSTSRSVALSDALTNSRGRPSKGGR